MAYNIYHAPHDLVYIVHFRVSLPVTDGFPSQRASNAETVSIY